MNQPPPPGGPPLQSPLTGQDDVNRTSTASPQQQENVLERVPYINPIQRGDFGQDDVILHRDAAALLTDFVQRNNGELKRAGEVLADTYRGVPDAIRQLLSWLSTICADTTPLLVQATEIAVQNLERKFIPLLNEKLAASDFALKEISDVAKSPQWNRFFSSMAERHPASALRSALKRENLLSEVDVRKSALRSPDAFCDEFYEMVQSTVRNGIIEKQGSSSDECEQFFKRISVFCALDECSTQAALYILARLSREAEQPLTRMFYRRLSQHVRRQAVSAIHSMHVAASDDTAMQVAPEPEDEDAVMHVARLAIIADFAAMDLNARIDFINSLLAVCISRADIGEPGEARSLTPQVKAVTAVFGSIIGPIKIGNEPISKLSDMPHDLRLDPIIVAEKSVLLRSLCHEEILENLFDCAFSAWRRPQAETAVRSAKKKCVCLLLAFAGMLLKVPDSDIVPLLRDDGKVQVLRQNVTELFEKLEGLAGTCEVLGPGKPLYLQKADTKTRLEEATRDPFLARGIVVWARECLLGGDNPRDLFNTAKIHLAFLSLIACRHVALRSSVVEALRDVILRGYPGLEDTEIGNLHVQFVGSLIAFLELDMGVDVVNMVLNDLIDNPVVDISHIKRFVVETFRRIRSPYSVTFAKKMLLLVNHERLALSGGTDQSELRNAISKFRTDAEAMGITGVS